MKLVVDVREPSLMDALAQLGVPFERKQLTLGDIVLVNGQDETIAIIERKTPADLASSIADGRYEEQSVRLSQTDLNNHNVLYLIEGRVNSYVQRGSVSVAALRSAIVSLNFYKGFSVVHTENVRDSALYLKTFFDKIVRGEKQGRTPYHGKAGNQVEEYSKLQQRTKRKVKPEEIQEMMLSQIPGINNTMARNVLTVSSLRDLIEPGGCNLDQATYQTSSGKTRKIPRPVVEALQEYLSNI